MWECKCSSDAWLSCDFYFFFHVHLEISFFPLGFYHDAKFMQEITASIKSLPVRCRKV